MISISACTAGEIEGTDTLQIGVRSASPTKSITASKTPRASLTMTPTPKPTRTNTPTVSPYPTFHPDEAVTHTPAPPAVCPEVDHNLVLDLNVTKEKYITEGALDAAIIEEALDAGASYQMIVDALDQALGEFNPVYLRDLTGDGVPELINRSLFQLFIYNCVQGENRRSDLPEFIGRGPPEIFDFTDMNANGTPDLVLLVTDHNSSIVIYEWNGNEYIQLVRTTHGEGTTKMSRIAKALHWYEKDMGLESAVLFGLPEIDITDVDGNGTNELILTDDGPIFLDSLRNFGPWRGKRLVYTWDGIHFLLSSIEMGPPEYRFQAVQDADQAALVGDYDRALVLYQDAIFNEDLASWTSEHRRYLAQAFDAEWEGKPTPTPPPADPDEYSILSAYSRFRIMLLYLMQSWDDEAQVVYETLQEIYPEDSAGHFFVEVAQEFREPFEFTSSIGYGCERAIDYVEGKEEILAVLGDQGHGSQSHRYAAEDICPFSARENEEQGHTAEEVLDLYIGADLIVSSRVDRDTGDDLENQVLYTMYLDGTVDRKIFEPGVSYSDPVWSPDCKQIAVSRRMQNDDQTFYEDIAVLDREGNIQIEIGMLDLRPGAPSWSPDGEQIVYEVWDGEDWQLYVFDLSTETNVLISLEGSSKRPDWSPTSDQILYEAYLPDDYSSQYSTVRIMNLDGSGQREIVPGAWDTGAWDFDNPKMYDPWEPTWSPDGSRMAFLVTEDIVEMTVTKIYLVKIDGSDIHRLIEGNPRQQLSEYPGFYYAWESAPVWLPDGKYILFTRSYFIDGDEVNQLCYANANTGEWSCLGEKSGIGIWGMDWCHADQ